MVTGQIAFTHPAGGDQIRSRPCPTCYVCGTLGEPLYKGLNDRIFDAPGTWNLKRCPNPGCGLVWLDPMPLEEDIGNAYERYYTHEKESEPPATFVRRAYRSIQSSYLSAKYHYQFDRLAPFSAPLAGLMYLYPGGRANADFSVFYLNAQPDRRLLDVGCGSGAMLKRMRELGWQVEGVDFDCKAVENARTKGLRVHLGSVAEQRFPDGTFDAVTISHVIEHVPDPTALLRDCYRILKPGGHTVVITPNASSLCHRIYGASWRGLEPPRHLHIFATGPLKAVLQAAGFGKIRISTTIRDASTLFVASRSIHRTGRFEMSARKSRSAWSWGQVMQALEWAWLKLDRQAGEEIAAIGQK